MLRHEDIWRAIDKLAHEHGLTPSGLARRAGLDATTFNRSKRMSREGKLRWPSTESVAKVLDVTNCSLTHLVDLISESRQSKAWNPPVISIGRAIDAAIFGHSGRVDNPVFANNQTVVGKSVQAPMARYEAEISPALKAKNAALSKIDPTRQSAMGKDLNGLPSTQVDDPNSYFLRITETGYEPHFRMGDVLIASPLNTDCPWVFCAGLSAGWKSSSLPNLSRWN